MQSHPNLHVPCGKADLHVPLYGEGRRSTCSFDAISKKAGDGALPKGLVRQLNALFPPQTTSAAGYGGSTSTAGYGGSVGKTCHYNQGIGNGSEGGDPGNSHPHGGSNDETGRTPGQRWVPKLW